MNESKSAFAAIVGKANVGKIFDTQPTYRQ